MTYTDTAARTVAVRVAATAPRLRCSVEYGLTTAGPNPYMVKERAE